MNILNTLLLLLFIIKCQSETLIYSNYFNSRSGDWYINYYINNWESYCHSKWIMGGYQCFDSRTFIQKTFKLQPHYQLRFSFLFWRIDYWNGDRFKVYIDNIENHNQQYYYSSSLNNLCGSSSYYDETFQLDLNTYHYSPTVQILISGEVYWGISDIQLFIKKCPEGCDSCNQNGCYSQILYIEYFTTQYFNLNSNEVWQSDNGVFYYYLLNPGGFYIYRLITWSSKKTIYLTPHDAVSIQFKIITINLYHQFEILIDDMLVLVLNTARQVSLTSSYYSYYYLITSQINIHQYRHNLNQITLTIRQKSSTSYTSSSSAYYGIRDFQLFLKTYDNCFDDNIQPFDGCFANIYDCIIGCSNCVRGICLKCQDGWEYYEQNKNCIPICGDSIITYFEECDDGNTYQYDGCYQCKYSCPLNCSKCQFGKCKQCQPRYELINGYCKYNCDGYEIQDDQENRNCINRINNLIENGHYQHNLFNNENSKYTLVSSLTCNLQDFGIFGYFYNQCRIPVIQYCKESLYDKCLECDEYYKLEYNKQKCTPLCNDGIVIEREQCDDQNNIQFDGCYKCQQSCLLECINCIENKCYQCLDGWQLIDYSCYQYCGDGQVAKSSMEQCDDGNYNDGDGCYECKFECFPFCKSCADRNTCLVCEQYFELYNNSCKPICGDDYILIGLEECEDGNDIPYDGCFNCQFQCEKECQICKSGLCIECIEGYMIIKNYYTQIQNKCGNGIYSNDEECDDGNLFDDDGCSILCQIESNWFYLICLIIIFQQSQIKSNYFKFYQFYQTLYPISLIRYI
ncbi:unnamed protein product [Paramecium primaurelia]|uniref:Insulin-like growth factor binding protein, N-terminal n=1 Tax=Paramecium primaurelia TaxID=5886 RepID=A0A8S1QLB1_PARPR|nr:unnamed protein product [Paramecium primaurelia]